ncbi:Hephaestin [Myotis davidii]|uniref:ferroxidase n=1 Tax=Myotis davidii TaxID=225400 RepID=L5M4A1_MYODS|nr:Hephaestin [Myotis davidii]
MPVFISIVSPSHLTGPVIRAEVGDTIQVIFYNRASQPFSIQPHGVFYEKDYEGTVYNDGSSHPGLVANPFEKVTYRWTVPPHAGPTAQDPACLTWMYFSAVDPIRDTNSGLVGPLLVCKAGALDADSKQKGVDKEFFLLFTVLDENKSWYSNVNQAAAMLDSRLLSQDVIGFQDSNRMHAINGFLFSNLPRLDMCKGDTVAWHLLGLGTETDVHGVMFQGNTVELQGMRKSAAMLFPHTFAMAIMQPDNPAINGKLYANLKGLTMYKGERVAWYMLAMGQDIDLHTVHFHAESFLYRNGESYRADVVDLFPGTFEVVEMVASNPGTWLIHCHVTDHVHAGMETLFTVLSQREHLSIITTITNEIEKAAISRDFREDNVKMLGMQIPVKDIEMLTSILIATGVILLLIALALGGVVWHQHRQKKLRRNRRSILDDNFKLLSLKN